jgi:hypothetical protein
MPKLSKDISQSQGAQEGATVTSGGRLRRPTAKVLEMRGKHLP